MKKIILGLVLFICIIGSALYLLNWLFVNTTVIPPERKENIPVTAVWAGGADGGSWIDCRQIDSNKSRYDCAIYYEFTGEIEFKGKMRLAGRINSVTELKKVYNSFDGEKIYLTDGRVLEPIK